MPALRPPSRAFPRLFLPLLGAVLLGASAALAASADLPRAESPEAEGVDPEALAELVRRAGESKSTGLVVLKNGKLVGEWTFGAAPARVEAMSVTKSIAGLAVLKLLGEGKLSSLDEPVHHFFPEWNQGRKKDITLRHLLTHTSGLQAAPTTQEIYRSPDFVRLALAAELSEAPGTLLRYNNKAVNLLAAIVEKASGQRLDRYLGQAVFKPLGITDFGWTLDSAGNPHVMAGLRLRPRDLAKLGQLMLDEGRWQGRQVLAAEWVRRATAPGEGPASGTGLLWWPVSSWERYTVDDALLSSWAKAGVSPAFVEEVSALKGRVFETRDAYLAALKALGPEGSRLARLGTEVLARGLKPASVERGPQVGFNANGYLGQFLIVLPAERLVAVRMYAPPEESSGPLEPGGATDFGDFFARVRALSRQGGAERVAPPAPSARGPESAR